MTLFSTSTRWDLTPNALTQRLQARRAAGEEVLDLTLSNPTECGLVYPQERILRALADPRSLTYAPSPLGLPSAREAVARWYAERGVAISSEDVVLTASTSEAYAFLFKLLADPGEAVLVPRPSYPLFDYLAALEHVATRAYRLGYDGEWYLDLSSVEAALGSDARALLLVSPHNPTGACIKRTEADALAALARAHALAIVSDEVFADYAYRPDPRRAPSFAARDDALCFTLGGLSKAAGLPQLKLGWIVVSGPEVQRRQALERLEVIADTYLSVATPVQLALPELLDAGKEIQRQIRARVQASREALVRARPAHAPWTILAAEAGWYAMLQVPRTRTDEEWAAALLDAGVWLHPGYFFDVERPGFLVLSLLVEPVVLERALPRLIGLLI